MGSSGNKGRTRNIHSIHQCLWQQNADRYEKAVRNRELAAASFLFLTVLFLLVALNGLFHGAIDECVGRFTAYLSVLINACLFSFRNA